MQRRGRRVVLLATVVAVLLTTACSKRIYNVHQTLKESHSGSPDGSPQLLAIYQPWFGTKDHINVGYSSQDRVVLEKQVQEARNLGIAGFVVNWYGPRKEYMDHSYALLQETAAQSGFKVAIQYDEAVDNPGHETDAVIVDLQYAYDRYISEHAGAFRSAYLRYQGRPVIFIFPKTSRTDWSRVRQLVDSWPERPLLIYKDVNTPYAKDFDGFYAWVQPGKQGWRSDGSNWGQQYLNDFYATMTTKYQDKIAVGAAWPGFDDTRASWTLNRHMNARCGRTFDDSLRTFRRYYDRQNPLPFLLIVTWNDYEEGTAIERGFTHCGADGNPLNQTASANHK